MVNKIISLKDVINSEDFLYGEYYETYSYITKNKEEIKEIWLFDRELSFVLLDYILLVEQLLKKNFISIIYNKYPKIEYDFKSMTVERFLNSYRVFESIDPYIFQKTIEVAREKNVSNITLQTVIHSLSLRNFNRILISVSEEIKREIIKNINSRINRVVLNEEIFPRFLYLILYVRNVAAHNSQIFQQRTIEVLAKNSFGMASKFADMLINIISASDNNGILRQSYLETIENYKEINLKYGIWK